MGRRALGAAVAWLLAYAAFYFSRDLADAGTSRTSVLADVPFRLLDLVDPLPDAAALPSGWSYLPQRWDIVLTAALILAGAWGLGHLALRLIRPPLPPRCAERTVFAFGLGLAGLSLFTLGCGLAGWLNRGLLGGTLAGAVLIEAAWRWRRPHPVQGETTANDPRRSAPRGDSYHVTPRQLLHGACFVAMGVFLLAMAFGAMRPPVAFDVKEYHLQGPKEFYQSGRVTFLPHNVYTSFPFLTETLSLLAMVLRGDWFRGALAGKLALMIFAPLTGLALYAAGRRWFGPTAGVLAATVFLTTPWTYTVAVIAYVEGGLTFYLFAALLAVLLAAPVGQAFQPDSGDRFPSSDPVRLESLTYVSSSAFARFALLAGLLAGSAMACKYPGAVQVVIPLGIALTVLAFRRAASPEHRWKRAAIVLALFASAAALTVGPWLLKNLIETGNPVYPLLYSIFGGRDWSPALNAQWRAAHSPDGYGLGNLASQFLNVTAGNTWLSPLLFALAPPALLAGRHRRLVGWLWAYVGFLFLAWWLLTHRIDRFWIPLLPVVALLAGIGATWTADRRWTVPCAALFAVAVPFNLTLIAAGPFGYGVWLPDLEAARARAEATAPGIRFLNARLPAGVKVLMVGEAQVFDARFPVVYNTVFDRSIFEAWFADPRGEGLRDAAAIRRTLRAHGITHVFVNWQEILRYRTTYGFTEFVTPQIFAELQRRGVLGPPVSPPPIRRAFTAAERRELDRWGNRLLTRVDGQAAMTAFQLYPVLP